MSDQSDTGQRTGLIILDDVDKRKTFTINMEMYLNIKLEPLGDANYAQDYLAKNKNVDLIICQDQIGDEMTVLKVGYYVKSKKLKTPIVSVGPCPKFAGEKGILIIDKESMNIKEIVKWTAKELEITAEQMAKLEFEDYYPVSITNFRLLSKTPVTIYDKDPDKENPYFSILNAESDLPEDFFKSHFFAGKEKFYVHKNDRLVFVNALTEQSLSIIRANSGKSKQDVVGAMDHLYKQTKDKLAEVGFDETTKKIAIETTNTMMTLVKSEPKLSELMRMLESNKAGFGFMHTVMISAVINKMLKAMNWTSKNQLETITFVCFFHDIILTDEEMVKIHTNKELDEADLTPEQKKVVNEHAFRAAELISTLDKAPFGAVEVICQHHGQKNGIGFPTKVNNSISGLAAIFQVAETYVHDLLKDPEFKHKLTLDKLQQIYKTGVYKEAVAALFKAS